MSRVQAIAAALMLAALGFVPAAAEAQTCAQLFAKYNGSSWWWGAFGNCKRPGGPTDRTAIFDCAWNQVPLSDRQPCLKDLLRNTDQTRQGIDNVVAANNDPCAQLFAKYNGSSWWWGAFGNCKRPGGPTDRTAIFDCAWNQVPLSDQQPCLKDLLRNTDQTRQGIDNVAANNDPCLQLFAKYNGSSWWWGAFGNCKRPGGPTDRTAIFDCAWNQVPLSDQQPCLKDLLRNTDQTRQGIDNVAANNDPCAQLFAKYNGSSWWWGAFGNCKRPGGPTDRTAIFDCAWNQVPLSDQQPCLKDLLRNTDQTREGIDNVAANNDPCLQLFAKYNGSSWWWGAFGNCKRPGGPTDRTAIFDCAWNQVPLSDQQPCLKDLLRNTDQTRQGIDNVAANNDPCAQLFAKYNGSSWWWGAFGNCKRPGGPTDRTAIFDCAWNQVPLSDQPPCLKDLLRNTDQTREGIDNVAAHNWPISNNRSRVDPTDEETCHVPDPGHGYFVTPIEMMATPPELSDPVEARYQVEGRLRKDLRLAAKAGDPIHSLLWSTFHFASGNPSLGNAFADLSVTGRRSFAQFRATLPNEDQLFQSIRQERPPRSCREFRCSADQHCSAGCPPKPNFAGLADHPLREASRLALERAYAVANILRVSNMVTLPDGSSNSSRERRALEWIAVSGEDDQPHRPVNVPSTKYPQFELTVPVRGTQVHTRYMIAQAQAAIPPTQPATGRNLPPDPEPTLAPDADVLIFVHGMDSRAEEAEHLADSLRVLALQRGKNYTVISVDLPSSGYSDKLDHCQIPLALSNPSGCDALFVLGDPKEFPQFFDAHDQHNAPLLDFIEDFVLNFVDTLEQHVPVKAKVRAVVGGSLGGNIVFRLGRRPDVLWIKNIVAWSPASIWDSLADGAVRLPTHVSLNHKAVKTAWMNAGGNPQELVETPDKRAEFFSVAFDQPAVPLPGQPTQPETWYSDRWPCKQLSIAAARLDRLETYDRNFRLWHWRLGAEQLIFSHTGPGPDGQPLYMSNTTRMLLACGQEDDFLGTKICSATQKVAAEMTRTPGRAIFLQDTGHSLDTEHPNYVARQIVEFLGL